MNRLLDWLNEVRKRLSGLGGSIPAAASVWHVDRDGRVRTDADRPVVLRAAA